MTINIGLVTSEALILGCDSVSSATKTVIDPFGSDTEFAKDANGKLIVDADGNKVIALAARNVQSVVSSVFGGVTKMFNIYDSNGMSVAAVTSGMAKLCDRTISSLAADFLGQQTARTKNHASVQPVVKAFLRFVMKEYESHFRQAGIPPEYRSSLNFLIGGYGKADKFPSLYEIRVQSNEVVKHFSGTNSDCGVAWGGQSDSVERLLRGYSSNLKYKVSADFQTILDQYREDMKSELVNMFKKILAKHGPDALEDIDNTLPSAPTTLPNWPGNALHIDYANLSMQNAVDFVSSMVNSQSDLQKFSSTIATVGGRTHIGVVVKGEPLNMINEQELMHKHTGYSDV